VPAARGVADLIILAPHDDGEQAQAQALAKASAARYGAMDGADSVPAILERLLFLCW
jgi:hypothetical protein